MVAWGSYRAQTKVPFNQSDTITWNLEWNPPSCTLRHERPQLNELVAALHRLQLCRCDLTATDSKLVPTQDDKDFSNTTTDALRKKTPKNPQNPKILLNTHLRRWTMKQTKPNRQAPVQRQDRDSYDSLAQTLHSQEPLAKTVRQLWHTLCLHILHWLENTLRMLMGSRHLPQLRWLYLPLPRLAPFLFTSSSSIFNILSATEDRKLEWRVRETYADSTGFTSLCVSALAGKEGSKLPQWGGQSHRTRLSSACLSSSSRRSTSRISSCSYSDRKFRLMASAAWGMVPGSVG